MKDTEELNVVYVRFDKSLDYKIVVNSFPIKKFLESAFGDCGSGFYSFYGGP